jgi:CubicO group peptidase (beta-lactamase class C family)
MNPELNEKVKNLIDQQISDKRQIGVQVCAYQYGEKIIDTWAGTMGPNDSRPIQKDSLFCSASTTKGVTSTALHILADKKILDYDDPVTKYWPEFGKHGKDKITIAQAFSHQTGVYRRPKDSDFDITDWESGIKYIENSKPAFEPGTKTAYQALTFSWIAGGIIQKASGKRPSDVIREEIALPLGLENEMYVGIPDGVEDRLTTLEIWDPSSWGIPEDSILFEALPATREGWAVYNLMKYRKACLPSSTGHFTAHALAKMYGALANGGIVDGVRLVSLERIGYMQKQMTWSDDLIAGPGRKSIGFFLGSPSEIYGPRGTAFGHGGAGGSTGFADPDVGLSIGITLNKMEFPMSRDENRTLQICDLIRKELRVNT